MLRDILERIEKRLQAVGLSASAASVKADLSPDAIRNIVRAVAAGKEDAGASTTTILKLAPILNTTASWLIEGKGREDLLRPEPWDVLLAEAITAAHKQGVQEREILRKITETLDEIERQSPEDMKLVYEVAQRVRGMKDSQDDGDT